MPTAMLCSFLGESELGKALLLLHLNSGAQPLTQKYQCPICRVLGRERHLTTSMASDPTAGSALQKAVIPSQNQREGHLPSNVQGHKAMEVVPGWTPQGAIVGICHSCSCLPGRAGTAMAESTSQVMTIRGSRMGLGPGSG